jgi:hypothetical protein
MGLRIAAQRVVASSACCFACPKKLVHSMPARQFGGKAAHGACQTRAVCEKQPPCSSAIKGENQCNQINFMTFRTGELLKDAT